MLLLLFPGCAHWRPQGGSPLQRCRFCRPLPATDPLRGNVVPVHDPSLVRAEDGSYRVYSTDIPFLRSPNFLEQRCSRDLLEWHGCGYVFPSLPSWVRAGFPEVEGLWAPDLSFFNGKYHLYYAASTLGSQHSGIGLATNTTLDGDRPGYHWADHGPVITSEAGDDFNAIDPNVTIEPVPGGKPRVWLNYGSYWHGIFQQELDSRTGKLLAGGKRYHLAEQPADRNGSVEGSSLVRHNGWYYLFASVGYCCLMPIERDTYQQIVGRSRSVHGPFVDEHGQPLLRGGGTVLLTSDDRWLAPGGGAVWQDADGKGSLIAFHALHRPENGAMHLWVERICWAGDWPLLAPLP